jgi:hypothetical protein
MAEQQIQRFNIAGTLSPRMPAAKKRRFLAAGTRAYVLLVLRTIQMIQQIPLLAFPAKAGIHFCGGHRLSPVKRY